ncbi:MAG: response regulator receiver protein [Pedosphaera sp.]|nr:response regulator receiver protein [Pedosphaera sp.]
MASHDTDILLVEDDPQDVELALFALRKSNLTSLIQVVRDGEEALDFLFCNGQFSGRSFNHPPRVVFLDLKLPKVDGLQVLRELKNDPRTKMIPIVVMTSSAEQRDLQEGYKLGVNSYIQKPVGFDAFQKLITDLSYYWLKTNQISSPPVAARA